MPDKSKAARAPRIVRVEPGDILTEEMVLAHRDPEKLIGSRHCRRDHLGRLVARRAFSMQLPAERGGSDAAG